MTELRRKKTVNLVILAEDKFDKLEWARPIEMESAPHPQLYWFIRDEWHYIAQRFGNSYVYVR